MIKTYIVFSMFMACQLSGMDQLMTAWRQKSIFEVPKSVIGEPERDFVNRMFIEDTETDKAFVKRTKKKLKKLPWNKDRLLDRTLIPLCRTANMGDVDPNTLMYELSPDESGIVIVGDTYAGLPRMLVIDFKNQVSCVSKINCIEGHFALSPSCHQVAFIAEHDREKMLAVTDLISGSTDNFLFAAYNFIPYKIAFNKQGTHVIVRGFKELKNFYQIFTLKHEVPSELIRERNTDFSSSDEDSYE